jgi:hypothetical protein
MTKSERIEYWKRVGTDSLRASGRDGADEFKDMDWKDDEYRLFGYFDCFRPDGKGVEKVLAGIVGGDEITQRLLKVFECTKESFGRYLYFIVCKPKPATRHKLIELTGWYLEKLRDVADCTGQSKLAEMLKRPPEIRIEPGELSIDMASYHNTPACIAHDMLGDWVLSLKPRQSDALWLHEAFYSIACSYDISHYLLWPLYREQTKIDEPFAPFFELWTHGARPYFGEPRVISVYVNESSGIGPHADC